MLTTAPRIAGATLLCVIIGAGALNALIHDPLKNAEKDIASFIRIKQQQPVIEEDAFWTITAAGDVMLSRFVAAILDRESVDYPYEEIKGITSSADIAFANLENPVGAGTRTPYDGLTFRAEPHTLDGLRDAGFDVLSIANNHMSDAGRQGVAITTDLLTKAGFHFTGAGINEQQARTPVLMEAAGNSIAFFAYGDPRFSNQVHFADERQAGIALADAKNMKEDVAQARRNGADTVVISLHAGIEYLEKPDTLQQQLLYDAADAGADLVLGHHPHVIQPLEKRGDTWIIDSMGNLVFDQMWSEETRLGMVMTFLFEKNVIREIEAVPIQMHNFAQARLAQGNAAETALERLQHPVGWATTVQWDGSESGATLNVRAMPLQSALRTGITIEKMLRDDLNANRRGEEYRLKDGRLTVIEDDFPIWESPTDWWVQDAHIADIDGEDGRELVLSVWKSGDFGSSKPFWKKENDMTVRHHVFVYEFKNDVLSPRWQSSNLPRPNCEMMFSDLDGDNIEELIALEGEYTPDATCTATTIGIWKWENWGFYNQWKSKPGLYWSPRAEKAGSGSQVIINGIPDGSAQI